MAAVRDVIELRPGGLYSSVGEKRVPLSRAWRMDDCTGERDRFEVSPRFGDVWEALQDCDTMSGAGTAPTTLTGAHSVHYGAWKGTQECIVIATATGDALASAFLVDVATGDWTKIDHDDADAGLEGSEWYSAQFRDWLYFINASSSKMYKRRIGASGTDDDNWMEWHPLIKTPPRTSDAAMVEPPYTETQFDAATTATAVVGQAGQSNILGREIVRGSSPVGFGTVKAFALVATVPSGIDLSLKDRIHFLAWSNLKINGISSKNFIRVTEDSAGTVNQAYIDAMHKLRTKWWGIEVNFNPLRQWLYHYVVDLSDITPASRNAIRRFAISVETSGAPLTSQLSMDFDFDFIGGGAMWDFKWKDARGLETEPNGADGIFNVQDDPLGVEYAYGYYDPLVATPTFVGCERIDLEPGLISGIYIPDTEFLEQIQSDDLPPSFGASVKLTAAADAPIAGEGYTRVAFFRRRPDPGELPLSIGPSRDSLFDGKWVRLDDGTVNNSGSPEWTDRKSWWELAAGNSDAVDDERMIFSGIFNALESAAIGSWKNHLVLGEDRKLWFSFSGNPNYFMPDPESEVVFIPEPGDFSAGRTVYLSDDRVDECVAFATRDVFYASSARDTFSMAGDNAFTATQPRRLYNSRGAVSHRGVVPWKDGAVVASYDGLWHFQDPRPGSDADPIAEELTFEARESWRRLIGAEADWATLVLIEWEDELWAFNQTSLDEDLAQTGGPYYRFLRVTREQPGQQGNRRIETGTTPQKVVGAFAVSGVGMRVLFEDGSTGRFVRSDTGEKYTTDGGADVAWSYQTGRQPLLLSTRVSSVKVFYTGSPVVTIDITRSGTKAQPPLVLEPDGTNVWVKDVSILPGHEIQVTIEGGSADAVELVQLVSEAEGMGYGQ